jgi:hypothetical protein
MGSILTCCFLNDNIDIDDKEINFLLETEPYFRKVYENQTIENGKSELNMHI